MTTKLREEIKPQKPLRSLEEEAILNLIRTTRVLTEISSQLLQQYGLTPPQYNVLRILRGAGEEGLGRNEIRDRMIGKMPDVTRLLDGMEEAGWVRRERSTSDRRCVPTVLTEKGRKLVDGLDTPIADLQHEQLGHLTPGQLYTLNETLTLIRSRLKNT